jgi:hypothetical protein
VSNVTRLIPEYPGAAAASADKSHVITAKLQSGPRSWAGELGIRRIAATSTGERYAEQCKGILEPKRKERPAAWR